jgi:LL-diaminopimelate aminotransferase
VPKLNASYLNLRASYLFAEIKQRTVAFMGAHPGARLINLGIGDVTQPLSPTIVRALHEATDEMARAETFRGYGPYPGYDFLLTAIAEHDFASRGIPLGRDEIFVSDGGKSDSANLQELFAADSVVALMDPVYPVYADSNVISGRSGPADASGRYPDFVYLPCTAENRFQPEVAARVAQLQGAATAASEVRKER